METSKAQIFNRDDYAQSANTLFHFMSEKDYIKAILRKKAIIPRYCLEDIDYLNISGFSRIAVLQKCFCDIPIHKIMHRFILNGDGEMFESLSNRDKERVTRNNTHPDFYGGYAIGFSKRWGENNNLQPVHYMSNNSIFTKSFGKYIQHALSYDDIADEIVDEVINRLCLVKPLRGTMERRIITEDKVDKVVKFIKNFHDEQEWRYIPTKGALIDADKKAVIGNINILKFNDHKRIIDNLSDELMNEEFSMLWLRYEYDDIRYIIVPTKHDRIDLIEIIMGIPDPNFQYSDNETMQKNILISKILVLEEIRKDW